MYDANIMHGLPIGVQIVGQRLQEEKVLEGMKIVEKFIRICNGFVSVIFCNLMPPLASMP